MRYSRVASVFGYTMAYASSRGMGVLSQSSVTGHAWSSLNFIPGIFHCVLHTVNSSSRSSSTQQTEWTQILCYYLTQPRPIHSLHMDTYKASSTCLPQPIMFPADVHTVSSMHTSQQNHDRTLKQSSTVTAACHSCQINGTGYSPRQTAGSPLYLQWIRISCAGVLRATGSETRLCCSYS